MNSPQIGVYSQNLPENGAEALSQAFLQRCELFIAELLLELKLENWDISLVFCDDGLSQELNEAYRHKKGPTDILSFSHSDGHMENTEGDGASPFGLEEEVQHSGDLVLSVAAWQRNCTEFLVEPEEELQRLIIHGVLHLAGWEHDEDEPAGPMIDLQEKLLQTLSRRRKLLPL